MARTNDFEFYRGEDIVIEYTVLESDAEDAVAQDISGRTYKMTITEDENSVTKLAQVTGQNQPTTGRVNFSLARAGSKDIEPGIYRVEFARTDDGSNRVVGVGKVTIKGRGFDPVAA